MDPSSLWHNVLERLRETLGAQDVQIWFDGVEVDTIDDQTVTLLVPGEINANWIKDNYDRELVGNWARALQRPVAMAYRVGTPTDRIEDAIPTAPPAVAPAPNATAPQGEGSRGVNPWQTFDKYIVGSSNRFAHAAAEAVAEAPAKTYNPLFIYGETGVGKTHLMHAIGNAIVAADPSAKIIYITAEDFVNRVVDAIRHRQMEHVRNEFRAEATVLLVDDVQFIAGRERTQEEFFHTFNHLLASGRQVVLTSDQPPDKLPQLETRLRTRFEGGLIADIQPPDRETRLAILAGEAQARGLTLPPDLSDAIVAHAKGSIRELKGTVTQLAALQRLHKAPLTVAFARAQLPRIFTKVAPQLNVAHIIDAVARYHSLRSADLLGSGRSRTLTVPRQIAMYLARTHTSLSFPELGREFGDRDHSTIRHGYNKIKEKLASDPDLSHQIQIFERTLGVSNG